MIYFIVYYFFRKNINDFINTNNTIHFEQFDSTYNNRSPYGLSTILRTCSAISKQLVNPGLSMPNK